MVRERKRINEKQLKIFPPFFVVQNQTTKFYFDIFSDGKNVDATNWNLENLLDF